MRNFFTKKNQIKTKLSGGRYHYKFKDTPVYSSTRDYSVEYGDTPYSLAKAVMGSERYWWVISDLNPAIDAFSWEVGMVIKVPDILVESKKEQPSIY